MVAMNQGRRYRLSVVIPALNEEYYISSCLEALGNQTYSGEYEVVVVDNGSTDRTAEIAERMGARVVREPQRGIARALIKGCAAAQGEILCFTDADTIVPRDWLARLNGIFAAAPDVVAAGGPFVYPDSGWFFRFIGRYVVVPAYVRFAFPRFHALSCVNMAMRRQVYDASGGFVPEAAWGQDTLLSKRLAELGKVVFDRTLVVATSFRRFHRGHVLYPLRVAHTLKELFVQTRRCLQVMQHERAFPSLRPIRVAPVTRCRRLAANAGALVLLLVLVVSVTFVGPSTTLFGSAGFHGNTPGDRHWAALTFDDGPNGGATERILNILKTKGIKATFFVTAQNARRYPAVLRREVAEGHLIGNHSCSHSGLLALELPKQLRADVGRAENVIDSITALRPRLFRPPFGIRSLMMESALRRAGYVTILWNDAARDYDRRQSPAAITRQILRRLGPGAIIDLHDGRDTQVGYSRDNLIAALPDLIDSIQARGYQLVTLDLLLSTDPYGNLR
jgi:peptidoglycan/xylan/chitin deacetylase (PgdA/CDA1 family)